MIPYDPDKRIIHFGTHAEPTEATVEAETRDTKPTGVARFWSHDG